MAWNAQVTIDREDHREKLMTLTLKKQNKSFHRFGDTDL